MPRNRCLDVLAALVYAFLYLPIAVLVVFSFSESRLAVQCTGFTWKWYEMVLHDGALAGALSNSLIVAAVATILAGCMGTLAAVGLSRYHFRGKQLYRGLLFLPIVIPEIAMAVSALSLFVALGVTLNLATVIVSHVVFCVAYVALTVIGRIEGIDPHIEEAARDLGAAPVMVFFQVTLPLLWPGVLAGCLMAFVLSLDDFVITQFTAGVGSTTLPLRIYSLVKFGVSPEINALSTMMMLFTVGVTLLAEVVRRRRAA